jgi:hypothetical protein
MTQNAAVLWLEILGVVVGAAILMVFAIAVAIPHRPKVLPGSSGRRAEAETGHEEIRPDEYIDSFSKEIEEAGGGLPLLVKLALPAVLLWWLFYLILNWTQR